MSSSACATAAAGPAITTCEAPFLMSNEHPCGVWVGWGVGAARGGGGRGRRRRRVVPLGGVRRAVGGVARVLAAAHRRRLAARLDDGAAAPALGLRLELGPPVRHHRRERHLRPVGRRRRLRRREVVHLVPVVAAEGVETVPQLEFLRSCDCDLAQGFLISRPMQADKVNRILRSEITGTRLLSLEMA